VYVTTVNDLQFAQNDTIMSMCFVLHVSGLGGATGAEGADENV